MGLLDTLKDTLKNELEKELNSRGYGDNDSSWHSFRDLANASQNELQKAIVAQALREVTTADDFNSFGDLAAALKGGIEKTTRKPTGFEMKAALKEVKNALNDAAEETADAFRNNMVFTPWDDPEEEKKSEDDQSNGQDEDISKNEEALSEGQGEDKKEESNSPDYDVDEMAGEFILGAWGNGQDRIDNMLNAGYTLDDYNKIQQRVNEAYASGRDLHEWTNKANEKLHYW